MTRINKLMDCLGVDSFKEEQLNIINEHDKFNKDYLKKFLISGISFFCLSQVKPNGVWLNLGLLLVDVFISIYMIRLVWCLLFSDSKLVNKLKKSLK